MFVQLSCNTLLFLTSARATTHRVILLKGWVLCSLFRNLPKVFNVTQP
uniref:Uncharacterized protein n=1 Tax=uncultured marine microorganism HF4000_APKG10F17 TaxID=455558 RepID=B3TC30_9ZZZZ|nr:hypothetical protein ALOHA_HF4000APKG10F17ctg1g39 [uncultured marine microorganism HF4000_APKG10F17]